ncbi:MAG TPA: rhomboid family intramembrane serine protease [Solirubrobacteraceae bacterium]
MALDALAYLLSPRHGGLPPVLLDILLLVLLGPTLESALGRVRFCGLCLLGGLLAVAAQALLHDGAPGPVVFGAAGASAAVLGGYLAIHPRARVLTMILVPFLATLVELPVALCLGAWLLAQILLAGESASYVSHAGAFVFGLVLIGSLAKASA